MQELVLELNNIEKSYNGKTILSIDHLSVYQNEKIGIIGENGQGKSTLLNIINQSAQPDSGHVYKHISFHYFKQIDRVKAIDYENMDPELVSRLGVPEYPSQYFSGGEETRLKLADVLSNYSMGLLLDEPTTHLDTKGIRFLMNELTYYYGTLLVVSHDRHFLDKVVDTIWEVDNGEVTVFKGNYSSYLQQKEQMKLENERLHNNYQKEKSRLLKAARQKEEQAKSISNVSQKQKSRNIKPSRLSSSKQKDTVQKAAHKTAKAIEKRVDNLDAVELLSEPKAIHFPASTTVSIHNPYPIMGEAVSICRGGKVLLEQCDFQFKRGKKIGIAGPNGSGKTSLLTHILNNQEGITLSPKVKFSVYRQMSYKFTKETSVIHYLMDESEYPESIVRAVLNNIGFTHQNINQSVTELSGGEATRLALAKLFTDPSNVLILDEPTNFIDVKTIEALEELLKSYKGTVLFTSHDEYFMTKVADEIWEIKDKKLVMK